VTRRERGISAYARIFGAPEADLPATFAKRVGPVFAEEALQTAGGPAWSDPALTDRERGIAIITALAAKASRGGETVHGDPLLPEGEVWPE
jgi:4-carboxymuconolactone decarboxylase